MSVTPPGPRAKRVWRSGVRFDCPECGLLWRDDAQHAEVRPEPCPDCGGTLGLVGLGERIVEHAKWFRCRSCAQLWMWRRRELVRTGTRSGFNDYA